MVLFDIIIGQRINFDSSSSQFLTMLRAIINLIINFNQQSVKKIMGRARGKHVFFSKLGGEAGG